MRFIAGLDVEHRPRLLEILQSLHRDRKPRILLALRSHDPIPDWISHVVLVRGNKAIAGLKDQVLHDFEPATLSRSTPSDTKQTVQGEVLIEMKHVNVQYGPRTVRV